MAKLRSANLADIPATGANAAVNISDLEKVYIFMYGTFAGTWRVQVSFDGGTTWATFATGNEASSLLVGPLPPATRARVDWTRTSGTIKSSYGGDVRAL